jgi:hypothetical protein
MEIMSGSNRMNLTVALVVVLLNLCLLLFLFTLSNEGTIDTARATQSVIPTVSTRGHFNLHFGYLHSFHDEKGYFPLDIPACSPALTDIVIFVHGYNANELQAMDQFDIVNKSLDSLYSTYPVIGFSWDSNTIRPFIPQIFSWDVANNIAERNGLKLASFVSDFKSQPECENVNIRLISHSLGAEVVLNALEQLSSLDRFPSWNQNNFTIASVHLLGAAVDPLEVFTRSGYSGIPIQQETIYLRNGYCPEDDILQSIYYAVEQHDALGTIEASDIVPIPRNYDDVYVCDQISRDGNGDGVDDWENLGDNHMGYMGVVNRNGNLTDDGAMNVIVNNWNSE